MFLILFTVAVLASHRHEKRLSNVLEQLLADVLEAPEPARSDDELLKEQLLDVVSSLKELQEEIIFDCNDLPKPLIDKRGYRDLNGCPGALQIITDDAPMDDLGWYDEVAVDQEACENKNGDFGWYGKCCSLEWSFKKNKLGQKYKQLQCSTKTLNTWKERDGDHHRCEKNGNTDVDVNSFNDCRTAALKANAYHFSYYEAETKCYWSRTCTSPVVNTGWDWRIYDIPVPSYQSMGGRGLEKVCQNPDSIAPESPGSEYKIDKHWNGKNEYYFKRKDRVDLQKCMDLCTGLTEWGANNGRLGQGCKFISYDFMSGYCYVHQDCEMKHRADSDITESQIYCKGLCPHREELSLSDIAQLTGDVKKIVEILGDEEKVSEIKETLTTYMNTTLRVLVEKVEQKFGDIVPGWVYTLQNPTSWQKLFYDVELILNEAGAYIISKPMKFINMVDAALKLPRQLRKLNSQIHRLHSAKVNGTCMEKVCEKCNYKGSSPLSLGNTGSVAKCLELCQLNKHCAAVGVGTHLTTDEGKCMMFILYEVNKGRSKKSKNFNIYRKKTCEECMSLQCKNCGFDGYSTLHDIDTKEYTDEGACYKNCLTDPNCYGVQFDTKLNVCYFINNQDFTMATSLRSNYNAYLKGKCGTKPFARDLYFKKEGGVCPNAAQLIYDKDECEEAMKSLGYAPTSEWWGGLDHDSADYIPGGCSITEDTNKPHLNSLQSVGISRSDPRQTAICRWEMPTDSIVIGGEHVLAPPSMYSVHDQIDTATFNIQKDRCYPENQIKSSLECETAARGFSYTFNDHPGGTLFWKTNDHFNGCLYNAETNEIFFKEGEEYDETSVFDAVCRTGSPKTCPQLVRHNGYWLGNADKDILHSTGFCLSECMKNSECGGITVNHPPYETGGIFNWDPRKARCWVQPKEWADKTYKDAMKDMWKDAWKKSTCYECMNMQCTNCESVGNPNFESVYLGKRSYDVCLQACRGDPECYGVDVGRIGTDAELDCYKFFKTSTTATFVSERYDSWMKGSCEKKSQEICMENDCYDCEYFGEGKLMVAGNGSVEDCKNLCLKDRSCVGINASENWCYFRQSINVAIMSHASDPGWQAWRKSNDCAYDNMGRVGYKKVCSNGGLDSNISPGDGFLQDGEKTGIGEYYKNDQTLRQCKQLCSNLNEWGCKFISWDSETKVCYVHTKCSKFDDSTHKTQIYCHGTCDNEVPYESLGAVGKNQICVNGDNSPSDPGAHFQIDGKGAGKNEYYFKTDAQQETTLDECKKLCSDLATWGCKFISWSGNCYVHKECTQFSSAIDSDSEGAQVYCQGVCPSEYTSSYESSGAVGKKKVCTNPPDHRPNSPGDDYKMDGKGTGHYEYYYSIDGATTLDQCKDLCSGLFYWGCKFISWGPNDEAETGPCYVHKECSRLSSATSSDIANAQVYCQGTCPENMKRRTYEPLPGTVGTAKICMNPANLPTSPSDDYTKDGKDAGLGEYFYTGNSEQSTTLDQCKDLCSGLSDWGCKFISWSGNCYVHKECSQLASAIGSDSEAAQVYCQDGCPAEYTASYKSKGDGVNSVCKNTGSGSGWTSTSPGRDYEQDGVGTGMNEWYYKNGKDITLLKCQDLCTGLQDWGPGCKYISFRPGLCYVHQICSYLSSASDSDAEGAQVYCQGECPESEISSEQRLEEDLLAELIEELMSTN
jgi:hypothetical protein